MIYTPEIMGNAVYPKLLSDIDEIICNVLLKNIEVERAAYLLRRPDTTKPYLLYKVNNIKFIVSALPDKQYLQGILKENYNNDVTELFDEINCVNWITNKKSYKEAFIYKLMDCCILQKENIVFNDVLKEIPNIKMDIYINPYFVKSIDTNFLALIFHYLLYMRSNLIEKFLCFEIKNDDISDSLSKYYRENYLNVRLEYNKDLYSNIFGYSKGQKVLKYIQED